MTTSRETHRPYPMGIDTIFLGMLAYVGQRLTEVILRIKRSAFLDVYRIVTSNSLAYMTPDYQVKTIRNFDDFESSARSPAISPA